MRTLALIIARHARSKRRAPSTPASRDPRRARTLPLLLLAACYSQQAYVDTIGHDYCARLRSCDNDEFEALYDDMKTCMSEWRDAWEPFDTCLQEAGCTFVPEDAAACGRALRKADCSEVEDGSWADECLQIYQCDVADVIETAFCSIGL